MKRYILSFLISFFAWNQTQAQQDTILYSFCSAGHTYGSPINIQYGLHNPFVDYIPTLNSNPKLDFVFFTGDLVYQSTKIYWDSAEIDLAKLDMPFHISSGNHDKSAYFENKFGPYYSYFKHKGDLFITLAPGLSGWNIRDDQLDFLTNTLDDNYQDVNNIYIMIHELIWWSPSNKYQEIVLNYEPHYPGSTNYESVVKPLLESYPNHFTLIAGDLGCKKEVTPFMYDVEDNITLIASGMGGGVEDNIIITDVYKDSVRHNIIALNGDDPHAFGNLEKHIITGSTKDINISRIKAFPNPTRDFLNISNPDRLNIQYSISNINGQQVMAEKLGQVQNNRLSINHLAGGIYFLSINSEDNSIHFRIIVK